jgi:bifunctional enzyme CysN/CysC
MNDAGVINIAAFVAPHEAVREQAKQLIVGRDRFLEVYCTAPMEVLRARDQSGAYRLADAGQIAQMPGVTAAFEEPKTPDLVLQTDRISVDKSVSRIVELMKLRGYMLKTALRDSGRARLRPSRIAPWLAMRLALPGSCKCI